MRDLLLPATGGGVIVQFDAVVIVWAAAVIALRHQAEWRLVAVGAGPVLGALIGLRTQH